MLLNTFLPIFYACSYLPDLICGSYFPSFRETKVLTRHKCFYCSQLVWSRTPQIMMLSLCVLTCSQEMLSLTEIQLRWSCAASRTLANGKAGKTDCYSCSRGWKALGWKSVVRDLLTGLQLVLFNMKILNIE